MSPTAMSQWACVRATLPAAVAEIKSSDLVCHSLVMALWILSGIVEADPNTGES